MIIEPIWISSTEHLGKYRSAISDTPLWNKLISHYKIPRDFPRAIVNNSIKSAVLPIVYFSSCFIYL